MGWQHLPPAVTIRTRPNGTKWGPKGHGKGGLLPANPEPAHTALIRANAERSTSIGASGGTASTPCDCPVVPGGSCTENLAGMGTLRKILQGSQTNWGENAGWFKKKNCCLGSPSGWMRLAARTQQKEACKIRNTNPEGVGSRTGSRGKAPKLLKKRLTKIKVLKLPREGLREFNQIRFTDPGGTGTEELPGHRPVSEINCQGRNLTLSPGGPRTLSCAVC